MQHWNQENEIEFKAAEDDDGVGVGVGDPWDTAAWLAEEGEEDKGEHDDNDVKRGENVARCRDVRQKATMGLKNLLGAV
ncbi:hypothetical protein KQX54_016993 [Cotesia glomerata]|uniref:Uncharacterized protein n=1 Tax=Cotesia glomerata TaxID=32391 RepID=A0AAV7HZN5_COTGL|nr:hypothetical protein KQX54_016993 [Cotesia glomerata]